MYGYNFGVFVVVFWFFWRVFFFFVGWVGCGRGGKVIV